MTDCDTGLVLEGAGIVFSALALGVVVGLVIEWASRSRRDR